MGILVDIILIAIILISAILGYKKGLVKLGTNLFAGIIAIVLTIALYKPVTEIVMEKTPIVSNIKNIIIQNSTNIIEKDSQDDKNKESSKESNSILNNKVTEITEQATKQVNNTVKNEIIPAEAERIARNIVYGLTAIILFIFIKILLSVVFSLLGVVAKLPILKQFNEVGGLIYGIVRGLLILIILIVLIEAYIKMNPESTISSAIYESYLTKMVVEKIESY
jgi:uncharacterized membrane protein required for colicin V production